MIAWKEHIRITEAYDQGSHWDQNTEPTLNRGAGYDLSTIYDKLLPHDGWLLGQRQCSVAGCCYTIDSEKVFIIQHQHRHNLQLISKAQQWQVSSLSNQANESSPSLIRPCLSVLCIRLGRRRRFPWWAGLERHKVRSKSMITKAPGDIHIFWVFDVWFCRFKRPLLTLSSS